MVGYDTEYPPQSEAQTHAVVLKVSVVDENETRLKENEECEDGFVDVLQGGG